MAVSLSKIAKAIRVDGGISNDVITGVNDLFNTIYGGNGDDRITGGSQNDVLVGEAGRDTLIGAAGDDGMWGGGNDDQLFGESGNDSLFGDGGDDRLDGGDGDDLLNGGAGNDTMTGGVGNDVYIVDSAFDRVVENAGAGLDHVQSSVSFTLGNNIEKLTLTGVANVDGTGNSLDNVITGNSGNNILNGGLGADAMKGGAGNDTYFVDNAGDNITELDGEGSDTIITSANYILGANVENVVLTGTAAVNGTGNALDNVMTGNDLINVLNGNDGNDTISGGGGNDSLNGGAGTDQLSGGIGVDGIFAGGGNDTVNGDAGNDNIYGDGGNDWISGGAGNDLLAGGQFKGGFSLGNDTFSWVRADVVVGTVKQGFDHVVDFGAGDKIDFSGLSLTAGPIANVIKVADTAAGTVISANFGGSVGFVDVVVLDNVHHMTLNDMVVDHAIVV